MRLQGPQFLVHCVVTIIFFLETSKVLKGNLAWDVYFVLRQKKLLDSKMR